MQIIKTQVYRGRNIYSHRLMIKMTVDLGDYYNTPTNEINRFNERLLSYIPGLADHVCSIGTKGGFLKRLDEGTYLGHVCEHSILEIQNMLGYDVRHGKTRVTENERVYDIIYEYELENAGIMCGQMAVDMLNSLINDTDYPFNIEFRKLEEAQAQYSLGPSTDAIYKEALKRGIPVTRIGMDSILKLGYGKYQKMIEATLTDKTSCVSVDIASDKELTKEILRNACIPVAEGGVVLNVSEALDMAEDIGYPVVVKPKDGNQGKGVSVNISCSDELTKAYDIASRYSKEIIVEKFIKGRDYRVLVIGNNVTAVSERVPPFVIGDGISTITELVANKNADPKRGVDHERQLTKIVIDDISLTSIKKRGYELSAVLEKDKKLYLRENANLSTGGTARDCTDLIHPDNIEMAVKAAGLIGLDIAGVDITTPDISQPIAQTGGVIIEINAAPGIRMHHYPAEGNPRNAAKAIVDMLYPEGSKFSIPIISVTGTNGKTTTTRMISHILSLYGYNVGMAATGGIYINNKCIRKGDTTGPQSARTILMDRNVDAAVLETARGGIVRAGLAYDLADVGIITNVSDDHLFIDGINTIEELALVKSLVVEAVKDDGYAVLNADDPMTTMISERVKSRIIYFSRNKDNIILKKHIKDGESAVFLNDDVICIAKGEDVIPVANIADVPSTLEGKIEYNIENSLAACAGCVGLGIPADAISKGLKTFYLNEIQNPGRFNIYSVGNCRVLVDYGHNIDAYQGVFNAAKKLGASRLVGVIGVPGDRNDQNVITLGRIAGENLDYVYIKEDKDLRGRAPGEIALLMKEGVLSSGKDSECIKIILPETEALEEAIVKSRPGDMVIVFYEKLDGILNVIKKVSPGDKAGQGIITAEGAVEGA